MASISWEMTSNREKICCGEKMFFFSFSFLGFPWCSKYSRLCIPESLFFCLEEIINKLNFRRVASGY